MTERVQDMASAIRGVDRTSPDLGHLIITAVFDRWPDLAGEEFDRANQILAAMEAKGAGLKRAQPRAMGIGRRG